MDGCPVRLKAGGLVPLGKWSATTAEGLGTSAHSELDSQAQLCYHFRMTWAFLCLRSPRARGIVLFTENRFWVAGGMPKGLVTSVFVMGLPCPKFFGGENFHKKRVDPRICGIIKLYRRYHVKRKTEK